MRNESIGFIFQGFNLIPDLNVFDNVDVPLRYRGLPGGRARAAHPCRRSSASASPRALKHYPRRALRRPTAARRHRARARRRVRALLLADEPTGNLDTLMARQVLDLLEEHQRDGTTIVMVTHDPELAARAQREVRSSTARSSIWRRRPIWWRTRHRGRPCRSDT